MLALSDSNNENDFSLLEGQLLKVGSFVKRLKKAEEDGPEPLCDELSDFVRKFRSKVELLKLTKNRAAKAFDKLFMSFGYSLADKKMVVSPEDKKAGKDENWKIIEMWKSLVNFRSNLIRAKKKYDEELTRREAEQKKAAQLAARQRAKAARRNKKKKDGAKDLLAQMEATREGSAGDIVARARARAQARPSPRGESPRNFQKKTATKPKGRPGARKGPRRGLRTKKR